MDPIIKKIQTAIFVKNFQIQNEYEKSNLLLNLREKVGDIFNGQPIIIPVPNDAPPEIPRMVLNSVDNLYSCNIALNRSDVFLNVSGHIEKDEGSLFEKQKKNSLKMIEFLRDNNATIIRIGFAVDVDYQNQESVEFLRNKFLKEDKFFSPKELSFIYNKESRTENTSIVMNNLITISGKKGINIIKTQIDINSLAEGMDLIDFSVENSKEIIDYSIAEVKNLIKTIFI